MEYRKFDNIIIARIDKGEEILEQLKAIAITENIKLASCTHNSSVQMSYKHFTFFITGTQMKMCIIFSIHCIDCTCQRCNFIISLKTV